MKFFCTLLCIFPLILPTEPQKPFRQSGLPKAPRPADGAEATAVGIADPDPPVIPLQDRRFISARQIPLSNLENPVFKSKAKKNLPLTNKTKKPSLPDTRH